MKGDAAIKFRMPKELDKILKFIFPFIAFGLIVAGLVLIVLKIASNF